MHVYNVLRVGNMHKRRSDKLTWHAYIQNVRILASIQLLAVLLGVAILAALPVLKAYYICQLG